MRKVNKHLTLIATALLLFAVSCSNKKDKYISLQEDFIKKWESRVYEKELTEGEREKFLQEKQELEENTPWKDAEIVGNPKKMQEMMEYISSEEGKKMQELDSKITDMSLKVKFRNNGY